MITQQDLDDWFTGHVLSDEQGARVQKIRDAAKAFAAAVLQNVHPCADQSAAVRLIREAMMTANSAISCEG